MKYLVFILLLISSVGYGQTTYYIRADSTRLQKVGGSNELIIENGTKSVTGGVLTNIGNGRTSFVTPGSGMVYPGAGIPISTGAAWSTSITNSSTVGQTLRVTGASTYAFGALDLADGDAITGLLPIANGGTGAATTSQNFAFIGPTSGSGAPSFRALVAGDLPGIPLNTIIAQTGNWSINNGAFVGSLFYNSLVAGPALQLVTTSTAAPTGLIQSLQKLSTSGTNVNAGAGSAGLEIENQHDGPTSSNFGIIIDVDQGTLANTGISTTVASDGAVTSTDIGGDFALNTGGVASISIGVRASLIGGAGTSTAGDFSAIGVSPSNTGAKFTAANGTVNNAINIAAGAMALNGSAGNSGQVFTSAGANTLPTWTTPSTVATAVPISGLTAATAGNNIDNAAFQQSWTWNSLAGATGLNLQANTTAASGNTQGLFRAALSGANATSTQTTYTLDITNAHTGTSSTNVAAQFASTLGTNNYAIIVPASSGSVGIGTSTPTSLAHINGVLQLGTATSTLGQLLMSGNTSGTATIVTPAAAGTPTLTLPIVTGTIVQYAESTTASSATPTATGDAKENYFDITALAANATFAAPSGTPRNHNTLVIRCLDNGTARTLAWNAIFRASTDLALPSTTVLSKTIYIGFIYNSASSTWDLVSVLNNF